MLELEVILDFACCACGDPMGVTVKCAGNSLGAGKNPVAARFGRGPSQMPVFLLASLFCAR